MTAVCLKRFPKKYTESKNDAFYKSSIFRFFQNKLENSSLASTKKTGNKFTYGKD